MDMSQTTMKGRNPGEPNESKGTSPENSTVVSQEILKMESKADSHSSVKRLPFSVDSLLAKTTKRRSAGEPASTTDSGDVIVNRDHKSLKLERNTAAAVDIISGRNAYVIDKHSPASRHDMSSPMTDVRTGSSPEDNPHLSSPTSPLRHQRTDTSSSHSDLQSPHSSLQSYSDDENDDGGEIDIDNDDDDVCNVKQQQAPHGKENSFQTYQLNVSGLIDKERFGRHDGPMGHPALPLGWPPHLAMPWMSMSPYSKPGKYYILHIFFFQKLYSVHQHTNNNPDPYSMRTRSR